MFRPAQFDHQIDSAPEDCNDLGVLLVNLGTPAAPTPGALRPYLRQFLSDRRVVEAPRPLWWLVLYAVILPFRSRRSARAYASIWTEHGSPLLCYSERLAKKLWGALEQRYPGIRLALAMSYGEPSLATQLEALHDQGVRRLLVVPLYPQYSATTTAAVFDAVTSILRRYRWLPELRFVNQYFQHPGWQQAVAESIRAFREQHDPADQLLFSFHGIPLGYFLAGDPYFCQCHASARQIAVLLELSADQWQVSFQSRLGRRPWLEPYTDQTLARMAARGIDHVQVVCPGFATDCLETLEEIALDNRERFLAAGGRRLDYIPALNDGNAHVEALAGVIGSHLDGWPAGLSAAGEERARRAGRLAAELGYPRPGGADGNGGHES